MHTRRKGGKEGVSRVDCKREDKGGLEGDSQAQEFNTRMRGKMYAQVDG